MSDLRTAVRALLAARGFTATAVLTLGAGMTLCVLVMTVMNAYLVRAMPYPAADRLYRLDLAAPGQNPPRGLDTLDWASLGDVVELAISWDLDVFYMLGGQYPEATPGAWVTPGYMQGLGVRTALGRTFDAADYRAGAPPVAIISHRIWHARFGGDPAVIGRSFQAYVSDRPDEAETLTVVGVLPPDHWHLNAYSEVLAPLRAASYPYQVRLQRGVSAGVAADRMAALVRTNLKPVADGWQPRLTPLHESYIGSVRPLLWSIGAGAALVMLIAGANVAVLLLVRGHQRQKELAVRLALGASHSRLARLLVLEGLIVGLVATAAGIAASRVAMRSLAPLIERFLERRVPGGESAFAMDGTVLAAAAAFGFGLTLLFAMVPLVTTWRRLAPNLAIAGRGNTDSAGATRTRSALIAIEVAASLTLLAGAALMAETALRMLRVDFGIRPDHVVTASLSLRQRSYPEPAARAAFYDRLSNAIARVPGVATVALGDWWPLQSSRPIVVRTGDPAGTVGDANVFAVSPGYFGTVGMTLRDGRDFTRNDAVGGEPVAIVSEALASRLWPGGRAIGQPLTLEPGGNAPPSTHIVVGVVNDVRQMHADQHQLDAYLPLAQRAGRFAFVFVRGDSGGDWDRTLRSVAAAIDPEVAVGASRPLGASLEQERAKPRFLAEMLIVFAAFASLLALVGMHGVIVYAVRQRQREIAVRVAIGANPGSVTRLFLCHGGVVLAIGIAAGLAGAVGLGRVLQSQLYGVQPHEPRLLAGAAAVFALCGLLAIGWPAWRASSIDPVRILKED